MNQRIAQIRKHFGLNQQEFADKIVLTKNYVSLLETGARKPSERTLNDICEKFGVDPVWLRTGEGDSPFLPISKEDRITEILSKAISGASTPRDRLIRALARLPDDAFPLIEKFILESAESILNEKKE